MSTEYGDESPPIAPEGRAAAETLPPQYLRRECHQGNGTSTLLLTQRGDEVGGQFQKFRRLPPGTIENETDYLLSSLLLGGDELERENRQPSQWPEAKAWD